MNATANTGSQSAPRTYMDLSAGAQSAYLVIANDGLVSRSADSVVRQLSMFAEDDVRSAYAYALKSQANRAYDSDRERYLSNHYEGAAMCLEIVLDDNADLFTDTGYKVLDDLRLSLDEADLAGDLETPWYGPFDGIRDRFRAASTPDGGTA